MKEDENKDMAEEDDQDFMGYAGRNGGKTMMDDMLLEKSLQMIPEPSEEEREYERRLSAAEKEKEDKDKERERKKENKNKDKKDKKNKDKKKSKVISTQSFCLASQGNRSLLEL